MLARSRAMLIDRSLEGGMGMSTTDSGWYFATQGGAPGQQVGPLSWEALIAHARGGSFGPADLVWHEQLADWRPASQIPGLFPASVPVGAQPMAAPAGYAAPAAYGQAPARAGSGGPKLFYWLLPLIALVIVGIGLGTFFGFFYQKDQAFAQEEGQILLEASGEAGPYAFAGDQFVAAGPTTTLNIATPSVTLPTVPQTTPSPATAGGASTATVLMAYAGDSPALYAGSKGKELANKAGQLALLEKDSATAAAFCAALSSDVTLRWSGGNRVSATQLRDYFAELTPAQLTRDTRLTVYGLKDGQPAARQSVLQAGQLVLVDRYGVPRVRCECGNPLAPPLASGKPLVYTGRAWQGFSPAGMIVIQQAAAAIDRFTLIDIGTGAAYARPAGTEGGSDAIAAGV